MLETQFPEWPCFTEEEGNAARSVLLSNRVNYWTGDEVNSFEREFAKSVGTRHAIAVANGSLALELALRACDIGPGDDVVVSPRSFVASASSAMIVGATPVFADVDRDTQNLTAATIEAVLTPATRAIIVVHLAGMPAEMDDIMALGTRRGLRVIEDCAQAHGARYRGRPVGSIGHIGAWSFCQDKIMSTGGEGGMVTTDDPLLHERMWSFKDHGKALRAIERSTRGLGFRWLHESLGSNYRLTEMQAAIGRIQLRRLGGWNRARNHNAAAIQACAEGIDGLRVPEQPPDTVHGFYKCYLFVEPDGTRSGLSRDQLIHQMNAAGVPCYHGACPEIYKEKLFVDAGLVPHVALPVAADLGRSSLMLLVHPGLEPRHLQRTCDVLTDVCDSTCSVASK